MRGLFSGQIAAVTPPPSPCMPRCFLQAARALTPTYQLVYPEIWPNLGLHYATLAKLELLQCGQQGMQQQQQQGMRQRAGGSPELAYKAARAAVAILEVTHAGGGSNGGSLEACGPGVMVQAQYSMSEAQAELAERARPPL